MVSTEAIPSWRVVFSIGEAIVIGLVWRQIKKRKLAVHRMADVCVRRILGCSASSPHRRRLCAKRSEVWKTVGLACIDDKLVTQICGLCGKCSGIMVTITILILCPPVPHVSMSMVHPGP